MAEPPLAGTQLRRARKERGLATKQLAAELGIDLGNLYSIEIGRRGIPKKVLPRLEALGIVIVNPRRWKME